MPKIRKILAPIDFSDRSTVALEHGAAFARLFDAELTAAHFLPPAPYEYAAFDEAFYARVQTPDVDEVRDALERQFEKAIAAARPGIPVRRVMRRGDATLEIEHLVQEENFDLVVLPTHGYGRFRRFVLGSVANKVLHDIDTPVLTGAHVPEVEPLRKNPYQRIACAIDLQEQSLQTLQWAWELAQKLEVPLDVIHAAPTLEVGGAYGDWFPPETRDEIVATSRRQVEQLIAKVGSKGDLHCDSAEPVSYITETARAENIDLLVIGRRVQEGMLSGLQEHAYAIIRHAPCAVVSV